MESIINRIPEVNSSTIGGAAGFMRQMCASASTPSINAKEKARAAAQEKMTPNFDLSKPDDDEIRSSDETEKEDSSGKIQKILLLFNFSNFTNFPEKEDTEKTAQINDRNLITPDIKTDEAPSDADGSRKGSGDSDRLRESTSGSKLRQADDSSEDEYLPLNNVVDWDEWNTTGSYFPPRKRSATMKNGKTAKSGRTSPKLKAKMNKKPTGKSGKGKK